MRLIERRMDAFWERRIGKSYLRRRDVKQLLHASSFNGGFLSCFMSQVGGCRGLDST
jgi:hypothetical protein